MAVFSLGIVRCLNETYFGGLSLYAFSGRRTEYVLCGPR